MFFRYLLVVTSVWFVALLWFSSDGEMSIADVLFLGYAWLPLLICWIVGFAVPRLRNQARRRDALLSHGLVFSPAGRPPVIGEDSYDHLVGNWWHWWRSW